MKPSLAVKTAALLAFVALAAARPAAADPPEPGRSYVVTLVTGDTVTVDVLADGHQTALVTPAFRPGRPPPAFMTYEIKGHLQVIPSDVAEQVGDLLDPALFDITQLIDEGYDDTSSNTLPLIITYSGDPAAAQAVPPLASLRRRQTLASIGGESAEEDKKGAAELGKALADRNDEDRDEASRGTSAPGAAASGSSGPRAASTSWQLAGVERIWLDRKVRASLQESVPQIGAPLAWAAGFDGAGVTVAVLDTGVDGTHPDLAGKVSDALDFTSSASGTVDKVGHGTHVASTIAGTGAASNGLRKGVAPGAKLIIGKVLGDNGSGLFSWVIAGMEWAVVQKGARVVNMSLGSSPTDGKDPVSLALNRLSAQTGALFVVAGGNSGAAGRGTIGSPGAADAALTVGAVDKQDVLARFSSRGPRLGDLSIKPDLTAPGVRITAARAAGTSIGTIVDANYTSLSGTSMATPHVAGAAALMLQKYPAFRGEQVKAALVGTALPNATNTVFEQGSGRVDVARAIRQEVYASTGSINFGYFVWPHDTRPPLTQSVTYSNLSARSVTLALSTEVREQEGAGPLATPGMITVDPQTFTLPPGGSTTVAVTLHTGASRQVFYPHGGVLTAQEPGGAVSLRTLLSDFLEPETHNLTVKGIGRDGQPALGTTIIMNVDDQIRFVEPQFLFPSRRCRRSRTFCPPARVPVGTYSAMGFSTIFNDQNYPVDVALIGSPEFEVRGDMTIVLDARDAKEVQIATPDRETKRNQQSPIGLGWTRRDALGAPVHVGMVLSTALSHKLYLLPTASVTKGTFEGFTRWTLEAPDIRMRVAAPGGLQIHPEYVQEGFVFQNVRADGHSELPLVDAGAGNPEDLTKLDLQGKIVLFQRTLSREYGFAARRAAAAAAAGAVMAICYDETRQGLWWEDNNYIDANNLIQVVPIPTFRLAKEEGEQLVQLLGQGKVTLAVDAIAASPFLYELLLPEVGSLPQSPAYVVRDAAMAAVETRFHAQPGVGVGGFAEARFAYRKGVATGFIVNPRPVYGVPRTRIDYVTPGETAWQPLLLAPHSFRFDGPLVQYAAGERRSYGWLKQPLRASIIEQKLNDAFAAQPVFREGDRLHLLIPPRVDAQGNMSLLSCGNSFNLFRGPDLIGSSEQARGTFDLGTPASQRYRLQLETGNLPACLVSPFDFRINTRDTVLSTAIRTSWTVRSERPPSGTRQVLPLVVVDYDLPVDLLNQARRSTERHPNQIGLVVRHQAGAASIPIDDVELSFSLDDGKTWREVEEMNKLGEGRFEAVLEKFHGKATFVSLRVRASDEEGNRIDQEVIRAFATRTDQDHPDDERD